MTVDPSWNLAVAVIVMVGLSMLVSSTHRIGMSRSMLTAAGRATVQLLVVSTIVVAAVSQVWSSVLFVMVMFIIAVWTTTGRVDTRARWWWSALAMAIGILPTLVIIFGSGTAPLNGLSIVPIGSIITGNTMTAHTLAGRRFFPALREQVGVYEAGLALGMDRVMSTRMVLQGLLSEPLIPTLDSTRSVGLVTLPGAYIGVLLGGGSALQAGAAQLLVLIGILLTQTLTVAAMTRFITTGRLLPKDLVETLHP